MYVSACARACVSLIKMLEIMCKRKNVPSGRRKNQQKAGKSTIKL